MSRKTCGQCVRVGDNSSMACDCFYQKPGDLACSQFEPARREVAKAAWMASGSQSSAHLTDSLLGDVLEFALADFAAIYNSARGHRIDPIYVTALRHDVLIAIEAAVRADRGVKLPPQPDEAREGSQSQEVDDGNGPTQNPFNSNTEHRV